MNIVTYEQAKKLRDLRFDLECSDFYIFDKSKPGHKDTLVYGRNFKNHNILDHFNSIVGYASAPTISEALQFIRDYHKIDCAVMLGYETDLQECFYYGEYICKKTEKHCIIENTGTFGSFIEAEVALLDELLIYIQNKNK